MTGDVCRAWYANTPEYLISLPGRVLVQCFICYYCLYSWNSCVLCV